MFRQLFERTQPTKCLGQINSKTRTSKPASQQSTRIVVQRVNLMSVIQSHPIELIPYFRRNPRMRNRKIVDIMRYPQRKTRIPPQLPLRLLPIGTLATAQIVIDAVLINLERLLLNIFDRRVQRVPLGSDPPLVHIEMPTSFSEPTLQPRTVFDGQVVKLAEIINSHPTQFDRLWPIDSI